MESGYTVDMSASFHVRSWSPKWRQTDKRSVNQNGRFYSIPPSVATMFLDNEGGIR
jgi:hypothetical protein